MKSMVDFLVRIDRRWIFLLIAIAVVYPIVVPREFPERATKPVRDAFNQIENLNPGDRILFAFDYDPSSAPELQPMATAMTWHAAKKGLKLYFLALWPLGVQMIQDTTDMVLVKDFPAYEYGTDYVNLGYKPGQEAVIKLVAADLKAQFPADYAGASTKELQLTKEVSSAKQMELIVSISAGSPGTKEWVQYACTPYNIPIVGGCTGVQAPLLYPYYPGQMQGLLGAIKAASEYEELVSSKYPEYATDPDTGLRRAAYTKGKERMGPQLIAHVVIMLLIILGNVILFLQRSLRSRV
jgi:hypothetical protein